MALSQQRQACHWKLSPWDKEHGWDEWYEKAESTMRTQDAEIVGLREEIQEVKNDLRALTATMNAIANTLLETAGQAALAPRLPSTTRMHGAPNLQASSSPSSASVVPWQTAVAAFAPGLTSMGQAPGAHWPLPNPSLALAVRRPCSHGMKDQFHLPFSANDRSGFHAFDDPDEMAWRDL